jgi:peroxiredoxin
MKKNTFIGIAITISLLSLVWIFITPILLPTDSSMVEAAAPHKGFYAPAFTLETIQGETVKLSDYNGSPVLVFLWASWCSVCKRTMPRLQTVYNDYAKEGFEVLAVNLTYQDTLSTAETYFVSKAYTYPMLLDRDGSLAQEYRVHALPTSVLIAPDGKITDVVIGSGMNEGFLRARLNDLLNSVGQE